MSVCPYYLRGNCRYGNRCRLPHEPHEPRGHHSSNPPFRPRAQINPMFSYVAPSYQTNQNHHVQNRGASGTGRTNNYKYASIFKWVKENFPDENKALDILSELQREAKVWQKSEHLWRFTSKSLFPGGQPLEGWQDQSFEEVKWIHQCMKNQDQEHVYKKHYYAYDENIVRQLNEFATLKLDRLILLKDYIRQYVESNYKPSKTLPTDVEMNDVGGGNTTIQSFHQTESTNYTPDDQLLDDERAAFLSGTFEFGQIPVHAPSQQYC